MRDLFTKIRLTDQPFGNLTIKVVTTQGRVTTCCEHLKDTSIETQQGNIECAATQIINRNHAFRASIKSIGHRRRRGLIEQSVDI